MLMVTLSDGLGLACVCLSDDKPLPHVAVDGLLAILP